MEELLTFSTMNRSRGKAALDDGVNQMIKLLYESITHLQTLIIEDLSFMFPFRMKVASKMIPLPFSQTLKRITIILPGDDCLNPALSMSNVVWLLVLCPVLTHAAFGLCVGKADYDFMQDHKEQLKSSSVVKELALRFMFVYDPSKPESLWGEDPERRDYRSQKTEVIGDLLTLTKNLISLELMHQMNTTPFGEDETDIYTSSISSSLSESYDTLQHLRVVNIPLDLRNPTLTDYSLFKNLKIISIDIGFSDVLRELKLPASLEIINLSFYDISESEDFDVISMHLHDEWYLAKALEVLDFPALNQVVVPAHPITYFGELSQRPDVIKAWREARQELEKSKVFQDGKVILRKIQPGEIGE